VVVDVESSPVMINILNLVVTNIGTTMARNVRVVFRDAVAGMPTDEVAGVDHTSVGRPGQMAYQLEVARARKALSPAVPSPRGRRTKQRRALVQRRVAHSSTLSKRPR
jgi:hypothetical protein